MIIRNDPQRYADMSEPFESKEEAEQTLMAFEAELYELRCKHGIRDLSIVASVDVEGEKHPYYFTHHIGITGNELTLMAYGYAQARTDTLNRLIDMDQAVFGVDEA